MNHKIFFKTIALLFIYILSTTNAQTTGKVVGRVTDAETGEALPSANVIIVDTKLGAATDLDGDFLILNVPPGIYSIEARMVGYGTVRQEGVQISVNRTTNTDFALSTTSLTTETVVITADKISIQKDQTGSIRNVSSEDIEALPVDNIAQVVALQPGVVGNHFRGGRGDEVAYMVDGVLVTESFNQSNKMVEVTPDAVADLEVITGTFNAEYGNAMSGVVNVVTKDGGNQIEGTLSASIGNFLTSNNNIFQGLDRANVAIQDYKFSISGPIINDYLSFFVNGRYLTNDGHLYGVNRFNVNDYSDFREYPDNYISESNGDGSYVPMNKYEDNYLMGKLTFNPILDIKTSLIYTLNKSESQGYNHQSSFKPYGRGSNHDNSNMFAFHLNHIFHKRAFYELKLSYIDYEHGYYLYEDPLDPRYISDFYGTSTGAWFATGGQDKNYNKRSEKSIKVNFDLTWQLDKNHSIKSGINFSQINLDQKSLSIRNVYEGTDLESQFFIDPITGKITYPNYEPEIRSDRSIFTDIYKKKPIQFAAYIQDKMEFESMVINLGLRFDYFDPKTKYPTDWRNPANQDYFEDQSRISQYPDAPTQTQFSPRLGLSYQLGSTALLRFSYGHFFQTPPLNFYYQNHNFIVSELGLVGNPTLDAQKTVQYEIGFWKELTDDMNVEVAVFYRDIYNLLSSRLVYTYSQVRYGLFDNKDYGNARGFELKYQAIFGNFYMNANYTLQYSKGVADSPYLAFNRAGQNMDPIKKLIPLEWDQRHTFNVSVEYRTASFGATILANFNSGRPYSWTPITESPLALINLLPNNEIRPNQFNVDLNAYYNLAKFGNTNVRLKLLVYNLFDQLNEYSVNSTTGRAYTNIVRPVDLLTYRSDFSTYYDVFQDPSMYSAPRSIRLGLEINY
jgi:outer membrane receptor protein involved in Fe transport